MSVTIDQLLKSPVQQVREITQVIDAVRISDEEAVWMFKHGELATLGACELCA